MAETLTAKTIIIDVDGTIIQHLGNGLKGQMDGRPGLLPGVAQKFREWDSQSYKIIILTGRKESTRPETEKQLKELGLFWDQLIMGVGPGPRFLINDLLADGTPMAFAVNVNRNEGLADLIDLNECPECKHVFAAHDQYCDGDNKIEECRVAGCDCGQRVGR